MLIYTTSRAGLPALAKNASQPAAPDNATAPENATNAPGDGAGDDKKKRVHG